MAGNKGGWTFFLLTPKNENNYEVTQYIPREDDSYSISSNSVYSILQDSKGRMWIELGEVALI